MQLIQSGNGFLLSALTAALAFKCNPAAAQSGIIGWGVQVQDSAWNDEALVDVSAGGFHTVARRADGSVVAWGENSDGECRVTALPPGLSYVEVAAGGSHTLARRSDGSVVAWGYNFNFQCNVPALPPGLSYVEVAAGAYHSIARRSDGSLVAWGSNSNGQCNVPAPPLGRVTSVSKQAELTTWRSAATVRSSRGETTPWDSATCRHCPRA